jgi:MFS family permease
VTALSEAASRRNERVMAGVVFVVFTGFAFVTPFLPLYVRELGVEDESRIVLWAGVLIGIAPLLAGGLAPVWGRLADRYGHKVMAARALVSYVVIMALSALVTNIWQLFALRVGVGLFGGIGPLGLVMASTSARRGEASRAIGKMQAAQILSAAVGPFVGGLLADTIGIRPTFGIAAILCAGSLLALHVYYEDPPRVPAAAPTDAPALSRRPFLGLMAVLFFVNFVGKSFVPVLPLQIARLGVAPTRIALATGLLVSVYSVAAAASAAGLGRAARRRPVRHLLTASVGAAALLVAPIAWATSFPVLLALGTALGLAFGGALTLGYTIGDQLAPEARRGAAFGFLTGASLFGGAVSPSIAGLLARWDLAGIYYFDAAICALMALALLVPAGVRGPLAARAAVGSGE